MIQLKYCHSTFNKCISIYIVDKEEFRIDKSVKITRKEYNDLMDELYEFTETYNVFNGVETLNTDTDNTKNTNDKVV